MHKYLKSWFPCLSKKKIFKSQSYTYTYLLISFPRKEENRNRNDFTALKETYRNLHYQHHAPPFDGMWVAKFWASSAHVESTVRYIHTYTAAAAAPQQSLEDRRWFLLPSMSGAQRSSFTAANPQCSQNGKILQ